MANQQTKVRSWVGLAALLLLAACVEQRGVEEARYVPLTFAALPGWGQDDLRGAGEALRRSCTKLKGREAWRGVCAQLPQEDAALADYFTAYFTPWQIVTEAGDTGLFTGYYAPELRASRMRQGAYQTPLYGVPRDLAVADLGAFKPELRGQTITGRVEQGKFVPYPARAVIDQKGVDAPVLGWVADPVDVFFLQVQGSGRVNFIEGGGLDLGYAGQNGRPYVAVGKVLKEQGAFPDGLVTMPRIREWLAAHPDQAAATLQSNPSYVFFQTMKTPPQGAQGVVLTPQRSLAVDPRSIKLGTPVWLDAEHPDGGQLRRLLIAQDTGGAIKGAIRGDVYWGAGEQAAEWAGKMQSRGRAYILLPNGISPDDR